jgi:hypothetical protein
MRNSGKSFRVSGEQVLSRNAGRKLTQPLFPLLVVGLFSSVAIGQPWDGNGVEGDPYQIWTAADMQAIGADANYWSAHFKLMKDTDLSAYVGTSFNIIGTDSDNAFAGVFDGSSHTISNFIYSTTGTDHVGLFRFVAGPSAEVKNLGLIRPNINAGTGRSIGSLIGWLGSGIVSACYAEGGTVSGREGVGGLAGTQSFAGAISHCYFTGTVSGYRDVGGLLGLNDSGSITNS